MNNILRGIVTSKETQMVLARLQGLTVQEVCRKFGLREEAVRRESQKALNKIIIRLLDYVPEPGDSETLAIAQPLLRELPRKGVTFAALLPPPPTLSNISEVNKRERIKHAIYAVAEVQFAAEKVAAPA